MRYYSLNEYMKDRFGEKLYKLALDGGMSCPNRDGTVGTGGCIFCDAEGSGAFAACRNLSVTEQIEMAKNRVAGKFHGNHYIAYFQPFTNTYAPSGMLRILFSEAIYHEDIRVLSVATRPDCLPDDVVMLLSELNQQKPVWVELGLQTIHERTAKLINRGYSLPVFDDAVRRLLEQGIEVIVHVILGLPGETRRDMLDTVDYIAGSGVHGIKFHLLHVLKGTQLADMYAKGDYMPMDELEYIETLAACIQHLPPDMVIHRLTGDGEKGALIAPLWSAEKKRVLNNINRYLEEYDFVQGRSYR